MSRVVIEVKAGGIINDYVSNVTHNSAPVKTLKTGTTYSLNKVLKFSVTNVISGKHVGEIYFGHEV